MLPHEIWTQNHDAPFIIYCSLPQFTDSLSLSQVIVVLNLALCST
eukprot:COSAG02_NODE_68506_length_240_cov_95.411348_1_plen_44_part_10